MCSGKWGETNLAKIEQWKEGDEVDIEIVQNGKYTNFKFMSKKGELEEKVTALEARVAKLEEALESSTLF